MKTFRPSRYNYFLTLPDGNTIAYNFLYRTMLLFSREEYSHVNNIILNANHEQNVSPAADPLFKSLLDYKFLVGSLFDELEYFKFGYFQSIYRSALITMVLPTLNCNFDCPYCFEYKQDISLNDETTEQYLNWVRSRLQNKTHFHITWFGGEPLLAFARMKYITERAISLCVNNKCNYSASVTTNGYLLTEKVIKQLEPMKISNVHITLDGPERTHDILRRTRKGDASYARILRNIESWCSLFTSHLPLTIRINVTDGNIDHIPEIFANLSDNAKRRTRIYFRYVWSNEVCNHHVFASHSKDRDSFMPLANLYTIASAVGCNIDNPIDEINFGYCEVDSANHFCIDPRGYIYLCAHTFKPEEAIGHVSKDFNEEQLSHYCKWINLSPFNDHDCLKCIILPLCKGGCRKSRFNGKRACLEEKEAIDAYILNVYDKLNRLSIASLDDAKCRSS